MTRPWYDDLSVDRPKAQPISRITKNLYLGDADAARDEKLLDSRKIVGILNATEKGEVDNHFPTKYMYYNLHIRDEEQSDMTVHLLSACNFIHRRRMQGKAVLVHCGRGVSRSATIVVAYLMYAHRMRWYHALAHVKKRRPVVDPNRGFLAQLGRWKPPPVKQWH